MVVKEDKGDKGDKEVKEDKDNSIIASLATEIGLVDAECLAIFAHGASGYRIAHLRESLHEFVVVERIALVFIIDYLLEGGLDGCI